MGESVAAVDTGSSDAWPSTPGQSKEGALLGSPAALVDIFDTAFTSSVDRDNDCGSAGKLKLLQLILALITYFFFFH